MNTKPTIIILFCLLLLSFKAFQKKAEDFKIDITELPQNSKMEELGVKIYIHTSYKLYNNYPFPSNGLIISTREGIVLIDGAWGEENTVKLITYCRDSLKQEIKFVIGTHFHDDRIGGAKIFNEHNIPVYVTAKTAELAKQHGDTNKLYIIDNDVLHASVKIDIEYLGAAHTEDNIVAYIPIAKVLFGGCLVKSMDAGGMGNIADADLEAWPNTIKHVQKKFKKAKIVVPGHGDYGDRKLLKHTLKLIKQHK